MGIRCREQMTEIDRNKFDYSDAIDDPLALLEKTPVRNRMVVELPAATALDSPGQACAGRIVAYLARLLLNQLCFDSWHGFRGCHECRMISQHQEIG